MQVENAPRGAFFLGGGLGGLAPRPIRDKNVEPVGSLPLLGGRFGLKLSQMANF
jgi:hypothetical protein